MNSYFRSSPAVRAMRRREHRKKLDAQRLAFAAGGFTSPLLGSLSAAMDHDLTTAAHLTSLAFAFLSGAVFFLLAVMVTRLILDGSDDDAL